MRNLNLSERWMLEVLSLILPLTKGTFLDIGANVGQTLLKLKSVAPDRAYIGLEPNANCIPYLRELIDKNSLQNSVVIPVGISTQPAIGKLSFFSPASDDSSASVIEGFRPTSKIEREEFVPLFNVTTILKSYQLQPAAILKVDVEGAELDVFKSFSAILKEDRPILLFEVLPAYTSENVDRVSNQLQLWKLLSDLKYSIYEIHKTAEQLLGFAKLSTFEIHGDLNRCEYIGIPAHLVQAFQQLEKD